MRSHVRVGHDLIRHVPALTVVAEAVLHHHEWFDGTGYPDGLQGEQIPIAARIVCVVNSFGAMITRRSYKEAFGEDYARAELSRCAGTQFDPRSSRRSWEFWTIPKPQGPRRRSWRNWPHCRTSCRKAISESALKRAAGRDSSGGGFQGRTRA